MSTEPAPTASLLDQLRSRIQVLSEQALEETDHSQKRVEALMTALKCVFPSNLYRSNRPDLQDFDDEALLNHFVNYGINEGIATLVCGNAITESMELTKDSLALLEANHELLLKERDELARSLAATGATKVGQWLKSTDGDAAEGLTDKTSESLLSIHLNNSSLASDKWEACFNHYERHLASFRGRSEETTLLEIGVQNGGSLEVWKQYLGKQSRIIGTDINPATGLLNLPDSVATYVGDATDSGWARRLCESKGPFDIIIDDGSHVNADIIKTFSLFFPFIKPGGIYVCEDLHTAYWENYGGGLPGERGTAQEMFKEIADLVNIEHWSGRSKQPTDHYMPIIASARLSNPVLSLKDLLTIESIEFCNSMVFIRKKLSGPCSLGQRIVSHGEAAVWPGALDVDGTRG